MKSPWMLTGVQVEAAEEVKGEGLPEKAKGKGVWLFHPEY